MFTKIYKIPDTCPQCPTHEVCLLFTCLVRPTSLDAADFWLNSEHVAVFLELKLVGVKLRNNYQFHRVNSVLVKCIPL